LTAFVTSRGFLGTELRSAKAANSICQQGLATGAGLEGRFLAWIADEVDGLPSNRLWKKQESLYALADGTIVADEYHCQFGAVPNFDVVVVNETGLSGKIFCFHTSEPTATAVNL
jgi:hypothetical protein